MFRRMKELSEGKTTIFITHRLSSVQFCDRIFVFDEGCIVETGTHDVLMNKNGLYARLFSTQAAYYKEGTQTAEGDLP